MSEPFDLRASEIDQLSLFGMGEGRMESPAHRIVPDTELVRRRLHALLAKAQAATTMPWSDRDARMWQTVFPQMAGWLPDDEADRLRFEFAQQIERLRAA